MATVNLKSTISSISQLQGTCNTLEKQVFEKLIKLTTVLDATGTNVTEATFAGGSMSELGKARITEGGSDSAFIKDVKTAVSIGRS